MPISSTGAWENQKDNFMLKNKEVEISILLLIIRHLKGLSGAIEKYLEALKGESNA
jgi:hypothetical protein